MLGGVDPYWKECDLIEDLTRLVKVALLLL